MKAERESLISRLDALRSACDEPLLVNTADSLHSERAKQLRNGISVMIFSALEEFVRLRVADALSKIVPAALPFGALSEELRKAATLGAIQGLLFQQKFVAEDQKISFLSQEIKALATVADQNYKISRFAFAHSNANVQLEEITSLLEALSVEKPWETVYHTARRLKLATPNPSKAEFRALSADRHAAAHQQSFDIPNLDLKARIDSALSIGLALDVVISAAVRNLNTCMAKYHALKELKSADVNIFFVSMAPKKNKFRFEQEGRARALQTNNTLQIMKATGLQKLSQCHGVLVLHDGAYRPKEWYCEH